MPSTPSSFTGSKPAANPTRTLGLLGGMSSVATGEYYRLIHQKVQRIRGGNASAEMVLFSVDFARVERFIRTASWSEAGAYLAKKAQRVEAAGADCLLMPSNTMHRVRGAIRKAIFIPFIDIIETVSTAIAEKGLRSAAILGTYPVMSDAFYVEAYAQCGVTLLTPCEDEKKEIDRIVFEELIHHRFLASSKDFYLRVIRRLAEQGAECVILGCTEIKMLIGPQDVAPLPLFDTTEAHCQRAAALSVGIAPLPVLF